MTQSTTQNERSAGTAVGELLGHAGAQAQPGTLESQVSKAAKSIDSRAAEAHCRTLLEHLDNAPDSVAELEALLVLGLAHPGVFESRKLGLSQEGRRLAHVLEQAGRIDRAQEFLELIAARSPEDRQLDHDLASIMRRTGNADRLVDRYMRRAEECVSSHRTQEAITWLQEILLIDRSRRDVGRMIRDLRWGDQEKRVRWKGRLRAAAVIVLIAALVSALVQRELIVAQRFAEVEPAVSGNLASLRTRLATLDRLQAENPFSIQLWDASRERARLKAEIAQLEAQSAQIQIARSTEREAQLAIAESARKQGRIYAQQNRFSDALVQFERALADAPADWDQRAQIETDVAAIKQWIAENGDRPPGDVR